MEEPRVSQHIVPDFFESKRMQDFIREKAIREEDYDLIRRLCKYPGELYIELLHGHFDINRPPQPQIALLRKLAQAEHDRKRTEPAWLEQKKDDEEQIYLLLADFADRRGLAAVIHLERVLEDNHIRRKLPQR